MGFIKPKDAMERLYTPISNTFIDEYLPRANPSFVCVYLSGYRLFHHGMAEVTNSALAEKLGLLASDVRRAWQYWEAEKLVKLHAAAGGEEYDVEFLPVAVDLAKDGADRAEPRAEANTGRAEANKAEPRIALQPERPEYTVDELTKQSESNDEVRRLFSVAEKLYAKPLKYTELNLLLGLLDWVKLPLGVIEVLLEYCLSNEHRSWRYIEKVALDWADNGIDTVEAAEAYIHRFSNEYREIMKAFGQSRRDPTTKEIAYMKKWLTEFDMPIALVKEACDRTIMQIGQPKYSYADTIVTDWHEKGARTIEAVEALEEAFRKNAGAQAEARAKGKDAPKAKPAKSKFNNYTGRKWDYEMLERMAQERLDGGQPQDSADTNINTNTDTE